MPLAMRAVRALKDNYAYVLRDEATGRTAAIDPSEAEPVRRALADLGWDPLHAILCTHHHWDHVGGNLDLAEDMRCEVVCSDYDRGRVPGATRGLSDGESFALGESSLRAIAIPGHTLGHMALWSAADDVAFCGDSLFAMGAGRLFEGTAEQLRASLARLASLPRATQMAYGHEYADNNAAFAQSLAGGPGKDEAVDERRTVLRDELARGGHGTFRPLAEELETNPFFRVEKAAYRRAVGLGAVSAAEAFAELRRRRDAW